MSKIDKRDFRILNMLLEDSRRNFSEIGKDIRLSKNSVIYRVERLIKKGIIRRFTCIAGIGAIGKNTFYVMFKLRANKEESEKIIQYFSTHPLTLWVLELTGNWDLLVEFICDDIHHFGNILNETSRFLGKLLIEYKSWVMFKPYKVETSILFSEVEYHTPKPFGPIYLAPPMDEIDKKILGMLCEDGSIKYAQIATKLNLSADTIVYRMKNLIKNGVIRKFSPEIELKKLGYIEYIIFIKLTNWNPEKISELEQHIINNTNIRFSFQVAGELEIFIHCAYKNNSELDLFLKYLKYTFLEIIYEIEFTPMIKETKFNMFPEGLRK
ncbi:MAG: winged helix-turn-helix transcriptional regulator [Candidatus ainarchaeum sp.]|nr:winged helix-turn-helix transcriptional regulator [Candidatus ainarchaeum sp.]